MAPGERLDFEAPIEEGRGGGAFVRLPADAARIFGTRVRFGVQVTFNGLPYRGSTMPMGDGTFCVGVTKAIRAQAGVGIGDSVAVQLRRDDEERRSPCRRTWPGHCRRAPRPAPGSMR